MSVEVSIGLPFKDDRRTLELAIRSVFSQTHTDWELLLLDDGSADGCLELARAIEDPRVRVLSDGHNRGLAARLDELTLASQGEFIVRMDADDVMHPERVSAQAEALRDSPDVSLVASAAFVMDNDERVLGITGKEEITNHPGLFLRSRVIVHPTIAARRDWMQANPYDPRLRRSQDHELFLRTHPHSRFLKLAAPLLFYRDLGKFSLSKYVEQRRFERETYRTFGADRIGGTATARRIAASHAKEAVYRALDRVGRADAAYDRITRRRITPLTPTEADQASAALRRVQATSIPGLS